jgi:hypothetical protein
VTNTAVCACRLLVISMWRLGSAAHGLTELLPHLQLETDRARGEKDLISRRTLTRPKELVGHESFAAVPRSANVTYNGCAESPTARRHRVRAGCAHTTRHRAERTRHRVAELNCPRTFVKKKKTQRKRVFEPVLRTFFFVTVEYFKATRTGARSDWNG